PAWAGAACGAGRAGRCSGRPGCTWPGRCCTGRRPGGSAGRTRGAICRCRATGPGAATLAPLAPPGERGGRGFGSVLGLLDPVRGLPPPGLAPLEEEVICVARAGVVIGDGFAVLRLLGVAAEVVA